MVKRITGLAFCIMVMFLLSTAFAEEMATKTMNVNATVGIDNNTKELLEQGGAAATRIIEGLAKSLGMTVDKIFPYYVRQSYLKGITEMTVWGGFEAIFLFFAVLLLSLSHIYDKRGEKYTNYRDTCGVIATIMFIIFAFGLIVGVFSLSGWITQMKNPEYIAIQDMIADASKLMANSK